MGSNISDCFFNGVSTAKNMFFEVTQTPDFRYTDDLRDFIHSIFNFIGGPVCNEAKLLTKYYGLAIKVMEMPKNFVTLCWTPEPSFNFFTMNVDALKKGVQIVLDGKGTEKVYSASCDEIIGKLLGDGRVYYSYKNENDFKEHLIATINANCKNVVLEKNDDFVNVPAVDAKSTINLLDLKLVKGDERIHTIAQKCLAFASLMIPIAWAGSIGVFSPAMQVLTYVSGSLGQYRVFSLLAQIPIPTALVTAFTFENVIIGAFVAGLGLKTWTCVKAYFAAQADQKANIRNNGIANLLLTALCAGELVGGDVRCYAPLATGFNLYHAVSQPKRVIAPKA